MNEEKEITVKVTCSYEELNKILISQNFYVMDEYEIWDIYMIDKNIDIKRLKKLDILKYCILVRNEANIKKDLLYKIKEYDEKENIIWQGKVNCPITDIEKAINFMKAINYIELFKIYDKCYMYCDGNIELNVQIVNKKHIFIEIEDKQEYLKKTYASTKELIKEINKYNIPYEKDNYFVKKAEIVLNETLTNA